MITEGKKGIEADSITLFMLTKHVLPALSQEPAHPHQTVPLTHSPNRLGKHT